LMPRSRIGCARTHHRLKPDIDPGQTTITQHDLMP
jgi:hypothetical protein